MKSPTLSILLCLLLSLPVSAKPRMEFIPSTASPEKNVTRLEAIMTLNNAMSWWEDFRIDSEGSFWTKIWLSIKKFVGYLVLDIERLASVSNSEISREIFIASRWGMTLDDVMKNDSMTAWQFLELESQALSKALHFNGINRSLIDEVGQIRQELESVNRTLQAGYADIISGKIISKPDREFRPDETWVYYIFATQHDLLPAHGDMAPQEFLGKPLTGDMLSKFVLKLEILLGQMANDLATGG